MNQMFCAHPVDKQFSYRIDRSDNELHWCRLCGAIQHGHDWITPESPWRRMNEQERQEWNAMVGKVEEADQLRAAIRSFIRR